MAARSWKSAGEAVKKETGVDLNYLGCIEPITEIKRSDGVT